MFRAWKTSTVIAVLQALFGGMMYATTGSVRDVVLVCAAVAVTAEVVMVEFKLGDRMEREAGSIAGITAVAVYAATLVRNGSPIFFGLALLAAVLLPAVFARLSLARRGVPVSATEFAVILPFGVGTVLGGAVLLYRAWKKFCA